VGHQVLSLLILATALGAMALPGAALGAEGKLEDNTYPEVTWTRQVAVGERLICDAGSWTQANSFSYTWIRNSQPVKSGPDEYVITTADEGDEIWCIAKGTGGPGNKESLEVESKNSVVVPGKTKTEPPKAPELVTAPTVSGNTEVGATLSCSQGTWKGYPAPSFKYKWLRDKSVISGATSSTYTVSSEDEGEELSCKVTAENTAGTANAESSNSFKIPGRPPKNTALPTVKGVYEVGKTLTCSEGSWEGSQPLTFKYQWLRNGAELGGATVSTYLVKAADEGQLISCRVSASNSAGGPVTATSKAVSIVQAPPTNTTPPEITGKAEVGATLSCSSGIWSSPSSETSYSYEWVRGDQLVKGPSSSKTYLVAEADQGYTLYCEVTAFYGGHEVPARSQPFVIPKKEAGGHAPVNTAKPVVSGPAQLGGELTCSEGAWNYSPIEYLYQWIRNPGASRVVIEGATEESYRVVAADEGQKLACRVTALNEEGSASAESAAVEVAGNAPVPTSPPPEILGNIRVGEALTCVAGGWTGEPKPEFTYAWLREGAQIASGYAYTVKAADEGHSLRCLVTAKNDRGEATAESSEEYVPGSEPEVGTPSIEGTLPAEPGKKLTCVPGTVTGAPAPTVTYEWQLEGENDPSETQPTYEVTSADRGITITCTVTVKSREGTASATSKAVAVRGQAPQEFQAPAITGVAAVGYALTCGEGVWKGAPPPHFSFQWYRDGTAIGGQTGKTYDVESADEGHVLTCNVVAANTEGRVEAESSNGMSVPAAKPTTGGGSPTFTIGETPITGPSAAVILANLKNEITKAQQELHIRTLVKKDGFSFSFTPPTAGRLDVFWYEAVTTGHAHRTKHTELLVGQATGAFTSTAKRTLTFALNKKGRQALKGKKRAKLTVEVTFTVAHDKPVTWTETLILNR